MEQDFTHLENCYLVKAGNVNDILVGITQLFSDSKLYEKICKSGYDSVQKFSWNHIGQEYIKIYEELQLK